MIIWLTGLPCSGKTTIAQALKVALTHNGMLPDTLVELLDGDDLRTSAFGGRVGFHPMARHAYLLQVGYMAQRLDKHAEYVICSFVSPGQGTREKLPVDVMVHVECPLEVCEKRDVKGMYAKARKGELSDFTGVQSEYENPVNPDIVVHTDWMTVKQCVTMIMEVIRGIRARQQLNGPT